ncbi:MAG TPA: hypothetical protein EYP33_05955, partial [Pyrodictium sp.]|nr:hypothetical protein [Pyrodictium sp.]
MSIRAGVGKLRNLLKREKHEGEDENIDQIVQREVDNRRREFEAQHERLIINLSVKYNIIEIYNIEDPWVRVLILEDKKTGGYLYYVDEIPMTEEELDAYNRIMTILNWELKPLSEEELGRIARGSPFTSMYEIEREYFIKQVKRIVNI